ncbi:TonB family protein [candidate division KSB1 bacterium]|nr:TonB family protein [candidate division KSB1 bacterium]
MKRIAACCCFIVFYLLIVCNTGMYAQSKAGNQLPDLTDDSVKTMLKKNDLFDSRWNAGGRGFKNHFELQMNNGDRVIRDYSVELTWQQGGSTKSMDFQEAQRWILELNRKGYAGEHDWRLPTLKEAMSLMEWKKSDAGLHIDPMFADANELGEIWACDSSKNALQVWIIDFRNGTCGTGNNPEHHGRVRAVRSGISTAPAKIVLEKNRVNKKALPPPPARPKIPIESLKEDAPEDATIDITTEINFEDLPPPPPPEDEDESVFVFIAFDEPPQPIGGFPAIQRNLKYPEIARKAGVEGKVLVHVKIGRKGEVLDTKILKSLGNNGCDEAAVAAIKSVKWKPATQKDKPVTVWVIIPVIFRLK